MVFEVSRANEKQADGGGTEKACQSRLLERDEDMRFVGVCQEVVAASRCEWHFDLGEGRNAARQGGSSLGMLRLRSVVL